MERARKMLYLALKKQNQLSYRNSTPFAEYEENTSFLTDVNKLPEILKDQDFRNISEQENEDFACEENAIFSTETEEDKSADFDDDDSTCDPSFVPAVSDNVSSESDISFETKNAGHQLEQNLLFGDCETVSENEDQNNEMSNAKQSKKMRKEKRNSGKSYISTAGKTVQERTLRKLDNCRNKCRDKISYEKQQLIFEKYWELGSYELRQAFASGFIAVEETKSERKDKSLTNPRKRKHSNKYFLEVSGERISVCQKCFRYTLCESEQFIKTIVKKKLEGHGSFTNGDMRGRHPGPKKLSAEKENEIITFINSFPSYESHYTRRDTSKRYLSTDLSIAKLFRLYSEKYDPVSLSKFSKIFNTLNLKFKKPKLDTCHKCEVLKMKIDVASDEDRANLIKEQKNHHLEAETAYKSKELDKTNAENNKSIKVLTFDLQQCLPTPFLRSSVSFYKRPLWTYNLTVHDCITGQPVCYMWHEAEGNRGGNEISSCVFKHLQDLPSDTKHVILYSDCCPGQNKNSFIASMFDTFLQLDTYLEIIDHKFLLPGHTHMECDVDHALIEKKKKRTTVKIHHPRDWFQFVRTVGVKHKFHVQEMKQDQIFNFSAVSKEKFMWRKVDNDGQKFCWQNIKWMRFTKEFGTVYFKTSLKDTEEFRTLNIRRRGFNSIKFKDLNKCYHTPLEINEKKKQDLLDMLPLIDSIYHPFYQNLNASNRLGEFHPDLTEADEDEGSAHI